MYTQQQDRMHHSKAKQLYLQFLRAARTAMPGKKIKRQKDDSIHFQVPGYTPGSHHYHY